MAEMFSNNVTFIPNLE